MKQSSLFWGLVLVLLGVAFLAGNLFQINLWMFFWPVILILAGVWVLIGHFRKDLAVEDHVIPLDGAAAGRIVIDHGMGRLNVNSSAPTGKLLTGSFRGGVDIVNMKRDDMRDVRLSLFGHDRFVAWNPGESRDWDVQITREVPVAMEFNTGAGENRIDLTGANLTNLVLKTGASSTEVFFPRNTGTTNVRVEGGALSVTLILPPDSAARIHVESGLSGINVDTARFPRQGDDYISPDYHRSDSRFDISVSMGVGSLTVR